MQRKKVEEVRWDALKISLGKKITKKKTCIVSERTAAAGRDAILEEIMHVQKDARLKNEFGGS